MCIVNEKIREVKRLSAALTASKKVKVIQPLVDELYRQTAVLKSLVKDCGNTRIGSKGAHQ